MVSRYANISAFSHKQQLHNATIHSQQSLLMLLCLNQILRRLHSNRLRSMRSSRLVSQFLDLRSHIGSCTQQLIHTIFSNLYSVWVSSQSHFHLTIWVLPVNFYNKAPFWWQVLCAPKSWVWMYQCFRIYNYYLWLLQARKPNTLPHKISLNPLTPY